MPTPTKRFLFITALSLAACFAVAARAQGPGATLALPHVTVAPGAQVTAPLTLALPQGQVYSADVVLTYDPAVATARRVERGSLAAGWSLSSNLATPGLIRVALAGATPVQTGGELLRFVFDAVGTGGSATELTLTRGDLNEGAIPATFQHGRLSVESPARDPCAADVDGSGRVDVTDLQLLAAAFRRPTYDLVGGDGVVTLLDVMLAAAQYDQSCP